jgi:putative flippase GtrA
MSTPFPPSAWHAAGHGRDLTGRTARQVTRFVGIGIASTIAYVVLYAALRTTISAQTANALALLVTAIANTAANRRLTFGVRGSHGLAGDQAIGLVALGVALAITASSIGLLQLAAPGAGRAFEIAVLVAANAVATLVRFLLLRAWIGRPGRSTFVSSSQTERMPR